MGAGGSKSSIGGLKHCTLWKADRSPACRSVMMTLDALNLSVNEVDLNMDKGEHKTSEIIAMNSLQTLPILKDRELVIADSHCINTYLASRYSSGSCLFPYEHGARALVEQQMMYNCGVLQPKFKSAAYPILYDNCRYVLPHNVCEVEGSYSDLQTMLKGAKYFGGQRATLGDITILSTISTLNLIVPIDKSRFTELHDWLQRISSEMYHLTANAKGLSEFSRRADSNRDDEDDKSVFKCPRTSKRRRFITAGSSGVAMLPEHLGPEEKGKDIKGDKS